MNSISSSYSKYSAVMESWVSVKIMGREINLLAGCAIVGIIVLVAIKIFKNYGTQPSLSSTPSSSPSTPFRSSVQNVSPIVKKCENSSRSRFDYADEFEKHLKTYLPELIDNNQLPSANYLCVFMSTPRNPSLNYWCKKHLPQSLQDPGLPTYLVLITSSHTDRGCYTVANEHFSAFSPAIPVLWLVGLNSVIIKTVNLNDFKQSINVK